MIRGIALLVFGAVILSAFTRWQFVEFKVGSAEMRLGDVQHNLALTIQEKALAERNLKRIGCGQVLSRAQEVCH